MPRRLLPGLLVLAALLADASGTHGVALVFLLLGIPAGFMLALDCYGDALEARRSGWPAIFAGLSLLLLVLSAALRSPAVVGGVPAVAVSALMVALLLYGAVAIGAFLPGPRPLPESA
jgi:hypothetical protein